MAWTKIMIGMQAALCLLVLTVAAAVAELRQETAALEARAARIETATAGGANRKELQEVANEVRALARDLAAVRSAATEAKDQARVAAERSVAGPAAGAPGGSAPAAGAAAADGGLPDEARLDAILDKKLEEKGVGAGVSARRSFEDGKWKPPMEELGREVGLTPEEQSQLVPVFDEVKRKVFELAKTPRMDGSCFADDLAEVFRDPQRTKEAAEAVFMRLFTEKIPGRDEPYIAEILRIQKAGRAAAGQVLAAESYRKLIASGVDIMDVKTGYDPFAEYVMARLSR
ncbi:MAG: hypothetical protein HZA54_05495 [Planctomycetes bacterium]|nr:hypothetical protein [Planctomycetota bacterium]